MSPDFCHREWDTKHYTVFTLLTFFFTCNFNYPIQRPKHFLTAKKNMPEVNVVVFDQPAQLETKEEGSLARGKVKEITH